jgi:hypothetical protein
MHVCPTGLVRNTSLLALHAALNQKSTKNRNTSFSIFIMLSAKHLVNWKKQMSFFFFNSLTNLDVGVRIANILVLQVRNNKSLRINNFSLTTTKVSLLLGVSTSMYISLF